jgi:uncharacterized protein (DUF2062 family)
MKIKLRPRSFMQRIMRSLIGFIKFRLLHIDDTPQRIARGMAVGLWVAWTPLMGFHMLIALGLSILFRANKALAIALVWLSNPFTLIPVYLPAYLVGRFFVGWVHPASLTDPKQVADLLGNLFSFRNMLSCLHSTAFWKELAVVFGKIGLEVSIGGFVIGSILAALGYYSSLHLVRYYRAKKGRRRFRHHVD